MWSDVDIDEADEWLRSMVPDADALRPVQREPWASIFIAETSTGVVWLKACAAAYAFEVPLTAALSSRYPRTVTDVLASDVERRWLLMADAGDPLRVLGNPPERWEAFLPLYAELQIGESAHVPEHLGYGTPDLRTERLPILYEALLRVELPIEGTECEAIDAFGPRFADLCAELASDGVGPSVQHDDLHMNNVYLKGDQLRALDWGDASIAHPFFSLFEVFRFLREMNNLPPDDPWFGRLRDAYLEPWGPDRRDVFELVQVVGGFAHAIAWVLQRDALPETERPSFDDAFTRVLRMAIDMANEA